MFCILAHYALYYPPPPPVLPSHAHVQPPAWSSLARDKQLLIASDLSSAHIDLTTYTHKHKKKNTHAFIYTPPYTHTLHTCMPAAQTHILYTPACLPPEQPCTCLAAPPCQLQTCPELSALHPTSCPPSNSCVWHGYRLRSPQEQPAIGVRVWSTGDLYPVVAPFICEVQLSLSNNKVQLSQQAKNERTYSVGNKYK